MTSIDLNADVGESFGRWTLGDDEAILDVVSSANVACGFHAGDPSTLRRTVLAAARNGVVIGAQVGYADLAGFGRRFLDVAPADLEADVIYQIGALDGLAKVAGSSVRYVKPHGALYNAIVTHTEQATAVVNAVRAYSADLAVLGLPGSEFLRLAAQAGLRVITEAFADRAYHRDGTLVSRGLPGAVVDDPAGVVARVLRLVQNHEMVAVDGTVIALTAESLCVHGDTPGAAGLAGAVRVALETAGIAVRAFAPVAE